ncbi:MAG: hypothetical protein HN406_09250, partial [Lentisphaerae bacterium]|nr:hypothetical protein [Lentisphaerota bacterium]
MTSSRLTPLNPALGHWPRTAHHGLGVWLASVVLSISVAAQDGAVTWLPRRAPATFNLTSSVVFLDEAPADSQALLLFSPDEGPTCRVVVAATRVSVLTEANNETRELATAPCGDLRDAQRHELLVKRRASSTAVYLDGSRLLAADAPSETAIRCRAGYSANPPGIQLERPRIQPVGPVNFADDFMRVAGEMGAWTSQAGDWSVAGIGLPQFSANAFCFRGRGNPAYCVAGQWFWENYRVSASVRVETAANEAGVMSHIQGTDTWLLFRWRGGVLELIRNTESGYQLLATHPCQLTPNQWYKLSVGTCAGRVACYIDGALVFGPMPSPTDHGQIGLWAKGDGGVRFDDIQAEHIEVLGLPPLAGREAHVKTIFVNDKYMKNWSQRTAASADSVLDYTFHQAPSDWSVAAGQWGIQSRWVCQPRWTWFGGTHDRAAIVWHKARLRGDVSAAIYAAFRMDSPFDPVYRHPGDMNITICADGRDLSSGYTFVFAGWGNRWSRLLRAGDIVAETNAHLLPDNRDVFPYAKLHAPWYGLRVCKRKNRVECLVGDERILTYDDPEPLSGDRVAIWTWDNSLLLARATVTADDVLPPTLQDYAPPYPTREEEPAEEADNRGVWRCTIPGESFEVPVPIAGLDLRNKSHLSFRYRATPDLMANLYVEIHEQLHCFVFSAPSIPSSTAPVVGRFPDPVLDSTWRVADLDLLACLGPAYPEEAPLVVKRAFLGLVSDDQYVLSGFGGNRAGAQCGLRDVSLSAGKGSVKAPLTPPRITGLHIVGAPGGRDTFEQGLGQWRTLGEQDGATLARDRWHSAEGRFSMRLTNARLGGSFGAINAVPPFAPHKAPLFTFDYRITDEALAKPPSAWFYTAPSMD